MNQTALMILLMVLLLAGACCLFYYIFSLIMLDAKSRGIKNPKFWSLIATGLLLYLFARRKTTSLMKPAEVEKFLQLKRKIYCLLAALFVLFLAFAVIIFRLN